MLVGGRSCSTLRRGLFNLSRQEQQQINVTKHVSFQQMNSRIIFLKSYDLKQNCLFSTTNNNNNNNNNDNDNKNNKKKHFKKKKHPGFKINYLCPVDKVEDLSLLNEKQVFDACQHDQEKIYMKEGFTPESEDDKAMCGGQLGVVVRKPFLQIISTMKALKDAGENSGKEEQSESDKKKKYMKIDKIPEAIVLDGRRGTGKSYNLSLSVMWARANNWLTLYLPDSYFWVTEKGGIAKGTGTAVPVAPSATYPEMFLQPLGAKAVLENIKANHEDKLGNLPLKRKYEHSMYGKTLLDLVDRGLSSLKLSGDAMYDLRMELGLVDEYPVLIAVDQANCLYWPTVFYSQAKSVHPDALQVSKAFRFLNSDGTLREQQKLKRGLLLCASTSKYGMGVTPNKIREATKETGETNWFEPFDDFGDKLVNNPNPEHVQIIENTGYDDEEIRSAVVFYKRAKLSSTDKDFVSNQAVQKVQLTMGGNPRSLRNDLLAKP